MATIKAVISPLRCDEVVSSFQLDFVYWKKNITKLIHKILLYFYELYTVSLCSLRSNC